MMFAEKYRKAYDSIVPSEELYRRVLENAGEALEREGKRETFGKASEEQKAGESDMPYESFSGKTGGKEGRESKENKKDRTGCVKTTRITKGAIVAAAVFVCIFSALPVCAANLPAFYRVAEFISPVLADRLVPIEKSSSSQGITMEVEAIELQSNEAEIIVSVRDDEDSSYDRIHGEVDLFDSYDFADYGSDMVIGGCDFLTYDKETDKAYFRIVTQTTGEYRADKLRFSVSEILCNKIEENREIDLTGIIVQPAAVKQVNLSGVGGFTDEEELPDAIRRMDDAEVLDLVNASDCAADDFTVTGAAYVDGALRLQICMGDNHHADRHARTFLTDADGEERESNYSVSWQEEVGDTSYTFYEYWFIGEPDELDACSMYGTFYNSGESVEGKWEVTFRIE